LRNQIPRATVKRNPQRTELARLGARESLETFAAQVQVAAAPTQAPIVIGAHDPVHCRQPHHRGLRIARHASKTGALGPMISPPHLPLR
jgi:hypothetical protein